MGSLRVEFMNEFIEACLLLQSVDTRRPGCFFLQGQMHALMAAVLLGAARFDALDIDTKT